MDYIKRLLIESFKIVCLFSCLQFILGSHVQGEVFPTFLYSYNLTLNRRFKRLGEIT